MGKTSVDVFKPVPALARDRLVWPQTTRPPRRNRGDRILEAAKRGCRRPVVPVLFVVCKLVTLASVKSSKRKNEENKF